MKSKSHIILEQQISDMILGFYDSTDADSASTGDMQAMCDALAMDIIKKVKE